VFSAPGNNRVFKIVSSDVVSRTNKHTRVYPASGPSVDGPMSSGLILSKNRCYNG
jgi:hypothetical protein